MKKVDLNKWDFALVKGPMLVFILTLFVGSGTSYFIYNEYLKSQLKNVELERKYRGVQRDSRESEVLVKKLDEYQARFISLRERGYFKSDAKINWLEKIGSVAQSVGLSSVDYSIGSSSGETDSSGHRSGLAVESIPVTLQLKLLHEVDLLHMLDQISDQGIGLVGRDGCVITKVNKELDLDFLNFGFDAECNLKGYVIQFSDQQEV